MLLRDALKAKIPIIGVHTDDPVNVVGVLQSISKRTVAPYPKVKKVPLLSSYLYYTEDIDLITSNFYLEIQKENAQVIVVNGKDHPLVFDAGTLVVPTELISKILEPFTLPEHLPEIVQALHGLSIKTGSEVVQLTMARTGALTAAGVRETRLFLLGGNPIGMESLDTSYSFYIPCEDLERWMELNRPYLLDPKTPPALVPRGVMLSGMPGVGKSLAAKVIAKFWNLPLYRLDLAAALSKYMGQSEKHIHRVLEHVDEASPCVLLIDEVEKLFEGDGDEQGTTQRILSQLLWWLQNHSSRVVVVMTTNALENIPKEVYRKGRIDRVIEVPALTEAQARLFAIEVYDHLMPNPANKYRKGLIWHAISEVKKTPIAHVEVEGLVHDIIKARGWLFKETDE